MLMDPAGLSTTSMSEHVEDHTVLFGEVGANVAAVFASVILAKTQLTMLILRSD